VSDWYVRLANGSDAADGTTYATAKLTLAAAVIAASSGDTIYVSETGIGGVTIDELIDNLTIIQDPGRDQAIWIGATAVTTWTDAGGGVYTKAIAAGLGAGKVAAVLFNYLTQQNSLGSHYGTLKRLASAAAVVSAASGTAGCFYYESVATGLITAYFGGADPNSGVTHYVNRDNVAAIKLTGNGNRVSGIWFKAWHNDAQGACVWLENVTSSGIIENCKSWDCGPHAFIVYGGTTATSGGFIRGCLSDAGKYNAAHYTAFQTDASGTLTNCAFEYCHVERHNWLNIDQSDAGASGCAQNGYYAHADTGTGIQGIITRGCTGHDQGVVNAAMTDAGNTPSPGTANDPTTYKAYATGCRFTNMSRMVISGNYGFDKCVLRFDQCGSSALNGHTGLGCLGFGDVAISVAYRACEIYFNNAGGGGSETTANIRSTYAQTQPISFTNCSICATAPDDGGWTLLFYIAEATPVFTLTGNLISYTQITGSGNQMIALTAGGTSTANFVALDNLWGLYEEFIGGPGFSAAAPANEDASAQTVATNPFTQYTTDLKILSGSSAFGKKRTTSTTVPPSLINGQYDRSHGAYAQDDPNDNAMRGRGTDEQRSFFRER
jgi:hypothetical protein